MKKVEIGSVAVLDMISLPEYGIVIADYNKRLIVLDVNNLSVKTDEILLEGKPYGIAIISDHVVGISIGHTQIMTLDMRTKVPTHNSHAVADAGTQLWGLTYIEGDFFIAARDKIVRTNENVSQYNDVLCIPNGCIFYLQIHDRKLFFTDYKDKSFQCTTLRGEKLFKYQNTLLDGPYGFTRFTDAIFYVSDWLSDKVLKITCKTDEIIESEILLAKADGIFKPRVVLYEEKHKFLLIACYGGKELLQTKQRTSVIDSTWVK